MYQKQLSWKAYSQIQALRVDQIEADVFLHEHTQYGRHKELVNNYLLYYPGAKEKLFKRNT